MCCEMLHCLGYAVDYLFSSLLCWVSKIAFMEHLTGKLMLALVKTQDKHPDLFTFSINVILVSFLLASYRFVQEVLNID